MILNINLTPRPPLSPALEIQRFFIDQILYKALSSPESDALCQLTRLITRVDDQFKKFENDLSLYLEQGEPTFVLQQTVFEFCVSRDQAITTSTLDRLLEIVDGDGGLTSFLKTLYAARGTT